MPAPVQWLAPFQVNTGRAAQGSQRDLQVVGLANGNFLVAWDEGVDGSIARDPGVDIVGKLYGPQGNVIRDSFQLNTRFRVDNESDPAIAATNDGGFVLTFLDRPPAGFTSEVRYEVYNAGLTNVLNGTAVIDNARDTSLFNPDVAINQISDNFLVAVQTVVRGNSDIIGRPVAAGGAQSNLIRLAENSGDSDGQAEIAVLTSGNYVSVYREIDAGVGGIQFNIVSPTGNTLVDSRQIVNNAEQPQVAALANRGFVVAYTNGDVLFQIFNNNGNLVAGNFVAGGPGFQNNPDVVALPDNDFVVVWTDNNFTELYGRRFDALGRPDGGRFLIANGSLIQDVHAGVTGDGRLLFTWLDGEVFASIWDPRDATIVPSTYDRVTEPVLASDVITTPRTDTRVVGDGDSDVIFGQEGNDDISGGAGNDTLFGGAGNDNLNGGPGVNSLFGGPGNDIIFATNARSEINGGAGFDILRTTTFSVDLSRYDSIEQVSVFGSQDLRIFADPTTPQDNNLFGNGGDNIIVGFAGRDVLAGGSGNDRLLAGPGNDILIGGFGRDFLEGGGGSDDFRYETFADSRPGNANRDVINGFGASPGQRDRINLAEVDANARTDVDDAFTVIGSAAFSGTPGELRFQTVSGTNTLIQADLVGNGQADIEILVLDFTGMDESMFLL